MRALNAALDELCDAHMALKEAHAAVRALERAEVDKGLQHDADVEAIALEYGEETAFEFESRHNYSDDEAPALVAARAARVAASARRRQALAALDAVRPPPRLQ